MQVGFLGSSSGTGHTVGEFEFRSTATVPCRLQGYVGLQLLDAAGSPLETHVIRDPAATVGPVTLTPGSATLGQGHAGHGRFLVEWVANCDITGTHYVPENPVSIQVTPPDETSQLKINARGLDGSPMSVCPGQERPGTLHTKPVEAP